MATPTWTVQLLQTNIDPTNPTIDVEFTDNVSHKLVKTISMAGLDVNAFNSLIENMREGFQNSFSFIDTVDPKTFVLTPPTVTPTDPNRLQFNTDLMLLISLKRVVDAGVTNATADYNTQLAKVQSEYKLSYVG